MIKKKNEGFTLMELLAVIIILGLLMFVGIPRVTEIIDSSRRKTLISSISAYIDEAELGFTKGNYDGDADFGFEGVKPSYKRGDVASDNYTDCGINDPEVLYFIPIDVIKLSKGGKNPFGEWTAQQDPKPNDESTKGNTSGVLARFTDDSWQLGFQFLDKSGHYMTPTFKNELGGNAKRLIQVKGTKTASISVDTEFGPMSYEKEEIDAEESARVGRTVYKKTQQNFVNNKWKAVCIAKGY